MASRTAISRGPCGRKLSWRSPYEPGARGEARSAGAEGTEARAATTEVESRAAGWPSMEAIVERDNLRKALAQVKRNKGAAGVDGMSLGALAPYLKEHWPTIRAQLLDGTYKPQPVRRVEIPKASGGQRAGLELVETRVISIQTVYADFDDFWNSNTVPIGPQGKIIAGMSTSARENPRPRLRDHLPVSSTGRI